MRCIAYHVKTGHRCPRRATDRELCLCGSHARLGLLRLILECSTPEERQLVARGRWYRVGLAPEREAARRHLMKQIEGFGDATVREVAEAISHVHHDGHLGRYIKAVLAVATPILQAHVDKQDAALDALRRDTDRRNQATRDFVACHQLFANFVPTHTH